MRMFVFMVRDRATETFGTPMFLVSRGQAIRSFSDEVNRKDEQNQLYQHPDDFDLYECGEFESESGEFQTAIPTVVCRGKDVSLTYQKGN